jgi:hypothetical protein
MQPASRPGRLAPLRRDALTGTTLEVARADAAPRHVALWRLPARDRVLWATLEWKLLAHGLPGFGTAAFVLVNLATAERRLASERRGGASPTRWRP